MKKIALLLLIFTSTYCLFSQTNDTLNIVHYNILRYGLGGVVTNGITTCTPLTAAEKNVHLKAFIDYTLPDIFGVNEIGGELAANLLLNGAMNTNGRDYYKVSGYVANGNDIGDVMYYNSNKLKLVSQDEIGCVPRKFFIYNFKHKSATVNDSATFSVVLGHLKSSNTTAFANERGTCATNIMNYMNAKHNIKGNYFIMGDFNMYKTTEPGYINFTKNTNAKYNFYDPVFALIGTINNKNFYQGNNTNITIGDWNQAILAPYHTQSAQSFQYKCGAGGGLNDRFDYILCNRSVLDDSASINYVANSYKVYGNDGLHYNQAITTGANNSAPANIITALYEISDHLPVELKVKIAVNPANYVLPTVNFSNFTMTVGGVFTNLDNLYQTNSPAKKLYTIVGNGGSISGNNLIAIAPGTITITGKANQILGYKASEKTIVVTIVAKPFNFNILEGTFITNKEKITITTYYRTISGIYAISNNQMTITGTSYDQNGVATVGVFVGNQTITGNNIVFKDIATLTNIASNFVNGKNYNVIYTSNCLHFNQTIQEFLEAEIYDPMGRLVWQKTLQVGNSFCNIPPLASGIYLLRIQGNTNETNFVQKLIVE